MKKLLLTLILLISTTVMAQHHHGHWERRVGGGWNWVAPVVIGGVIGYELAQPRPPVVITQQPPVIIQQPQIIQQQNCSPWTEIRNPDGTVTVTRTCTQ
jgi:hypothetical protein